MNQAEHPDGVKAGSMDLVELVSILGEQKRVLIIVLIVGVAVSLALAVLLPRRYVATTVLIPPQQQQSAAAGALAQLGALGGVAGMAAGVKSPDDMYVAFFRTQRLQDALVGKFGLQERYGLTSPADTRRELNGRLSVGIDKRSGLIGLSIEDSDAEFAAKLANAHVDELKKLLSTLAVTEAQQRRVFLEQQVAKAQTLLTQTEVELRRAQARSGLVASNALAESSLKLGAELRAQIALQEAQLQAISRFATASNPRRAQLAEEVQALRAQLRKLEEGDDSSASQGAGGTSEALQAFRNLKVAEGAYEVMVRQLEIAKIDEAREGPLVQQVDIAQPPEKPIKPNRLFIVLGGSFSSLLLALLIAAARGVANYDDPFHRSRLQRLKAAWSFK